jgi:hypothetical protein
MEHANYPVTSNDVCADGDLGAHTAKSPNCRTTQPPSAALVQCEHPAAGYRRRAQDFSREGRRLVAATRETTDRL